MFLQWPAFDELGDLFRIIDCSGFNLTQVAIYLEPFQMESWLKNLVYKQKETQFRVRFELFKIQWNSN